MIMVGNEDYDLSEDKFINEIFKKRFSVRRYLNKDVEFDKITNMLEAARWAPSAGNLQELKYVIVDDKTQIKNISNACSQRWIENVPLIITVIADANKLKMYFGSRGEKVYSYMDGAIAAEHIMLEATRLGLGSCIIGAFDETNIKDILSIPEKDMLIAVITIGYTSEKERRTDRDNLNGKVFFEKYGITFKNSNKAKGNPRILEGIKKKINLIKDKTK